MHSNKFRFESDYIILNGMVRFQQDIRYWPCFFSIDGVAEQFRLKADIKGWARLFLKKYKGQTIQMRIRSVLSEL